MPLDNFFRRLPLMMHNLNVVFVATEVILNRLSFDLNHIPFIWLYGMSYIFFSWYWHSKVGVFYYFFLDYERPYALIWHLGLLAAVGLFFAAGWSFSYCIQGGVKYARLTLVLITICSMKIWKDKNLSGKTVISPDPGGEVTTCGCCCY